MAHNEITNHVTKLLRDDSQFNAWAHRVTCQLLEYAEDLPVADDDDLYYATYTNVKNSIISKAIVTSIHVPERA